MSENEQSLSGKLTMGGVSFDPLAPTAVGLKEPAGADSAGAGAASFEAYRPPRHPAPELFAPAWPEAALAIWLGVLGFVYWEWHVLFAAAGASLFYLGFLAGVALYLYHAGIRQNGRSLLFFGLAAAGAIRFALQDVRDIDFVAHGIEAGLCLLWIAYSCRTISRPRWDGFIVADWFNQSFIVPFGNFSRWFVSLAWSVSRSKGQRKTVLFLLGGLVVCLPVFAIVTVLLAQSDDSFADFLANFSVWWGRVFSGFGRYLFELIFAVPVAAYLFGDVIGNRQRHRATIATRAGARNLVRQAHIVPPVAILGPLAILVVIYLAYFAAMGTYLFSALAGVLPQGFSYAQYARRGFFELCGVATINLCALAVAYLFAKRGEKEYPRGLRVLGGAISAFTCLLIVTAMSKLALYIGGYGLSQLRLYAAWFLILLLGVFVTLVVWHVRPFDAGRPVAWIAAVLVALICLANTDGIVADYNVARYEAGQVAVAPQTAGVARAGSSDDRIGAFGPIDVAMLSDLNDAAIPALQELADHAPDSQVRAQARDALQLKAEQGASETFADWNLQSWLARRG